MILTKAKEILVENGLEKFTTNHIAIAAGMSVGSLYQYFPNKQAIIYGLYEERVHIVQHELKKVLSSVGVVEKHKLFQTVVFALYSESDSTVLEQLDSELVKATKFFPELVEIEKGHSREVSRLYAEILLASGANCSLDRAKEIGLFLYSLDFGLQEYLALGGYRTSGTELYRKSAQEAIKPLFSANSHL